MENELNEFISIVKENGFKYFEYNIKELKQWIKKLECLRTEKSSAKDKIIFYMLLELFELIENKYEYEKINTNINELENRFLEYIK